MANFNRKHSKLGLRLESSLSWSRRDEPESNIGSTEETEGGEVGPGEDEANDEASEKRKKGKQAHTECEEVRSSWLAAR